MGGCNCKKKRWTRATRSCSSLLCWEEGAEVLVWRRNGHFGDGMGDRENCAELRCGWRSGTRTSVRCDDTCA